MAGRLPRPWRSIPLLATAAAALVGSAVLPGDAAAAIAFVHKSPEASAGGTTITATLPAPTAAGHLLVAVVEDVNSNCSADNYSAPSGWTEAAQTCRGSTGPLELWYRPNVPAGITSVSFSSGSAGANSLLQVSEWSGVATTSPLDQTGTRYSSTSATTLGVSTSGNIATAGELAVTGFQTSAGLSSFVPGIGWSALVSDPGSGFDSDYRTAPSAGSTLSESPTSGPQTDWAAVIGTFKPSCSGGSLTIKSASSLAFPGVTLNAYNGSTTGTLSLTADDESGSGAGWNLNATSTTFDAGGGHLLPATATTITAGSASAATGNCTLPTNTTTYPVTLPAGSTPPTAVRLFDASASSGTGASDISLTTSVALPANVRAGSYSSTWTLTLSSGP
jgi:putative surface cell wall-binding protein